MMKFYGLHPCDLCGATESYYFKSIEDGNTLCPECYGYIFNKKLTTNSDVATEFLQYIKQHSLSNVFKENITETFAHFMGEKEQVVIEIPVRDENIEQELNELKKEISKQFVLADYLDEMGVKYNRYNSIYRGPIDMACVELVKEDYKNIRYLLLFGDIEYGSKNKYNELKLIDKSHTIQFNWRNYFDISTCKEIELYLVELFSTNGMNTVKYDLISYVHKGDRDTLGNMVKKFHHVIYEFACIVKKSDYTDIEWCGIYSKLKSLYSEALIYIGGQEMLYSNIVSPDNDFDKENIKRLLPDVATAVKCTHIWHFSEGIMRHLISLGINTENADSIFKRSKDHDLIELLLRYSHEEFPVSINAIMTRLHETYYCGRKPQSYMFQWHNHIGNTESAILTMVNNGFLKKFNAETFQIFLHKLVDYRFYEVAREFVKHNNITPLDKKLVAKTKRELKS